MKYSARIALGAAALLLAALCGCTETGSEAATTATATATAASVQTAPDTMPEEALPEFTSTQITTPVSGQLWEVNLRENTTGLSLTPLAFTSDALYCTGSLSQGQGSEHLGDLEVYRLPLNETDAFTSVGAYWMNYANGETLSLGDTEVYFTTGAVDEKGIDRLFLWQLDTQTQTVNEVFATKSHEIALTNTFIRPYRDGVLLCYQTWNIDDAAEEENAPDVIYKFVYCSVEKMQNIHLYTLDPLEEDATESVIGVDTDGEDIVLLMYSEEKNQTWLRTLGGEEADVVLPLPEDVQGQWVREFGVYGDWVYASFSERYNNDSGAFVLLQRRGQSYELVHCEQGADVPRYLLTRRLIDNQYLCFNVFSNQSDAANEENLWRLFFFDPATGRAYRLSLATELSNIMGIEINENDDVAIYTQNEDYSESALQLFSGEEIVKAIEAQQ